MHFSLYLLLTLLRCAWSPSLSFRTSPRAARSAWPNRSRTSPEINGDMSKQNRGVSCKIAAAFQLCLRGRLDLTSPRLACCYRCTSRAFHQQSLKITMIPNSRRSNSHVISVFVTDKGHQRINQTTDQPDLPTQTAAWASTNKLATKPLRQDQTIPNQTKQKQPIHRTHNQP